MRDKDRHRYDDMLHLPHHVSKKHPRMSEISRAAQFSPFAALTGHGDAIRETARLTDSFVELDDSRKALLDERLQLIRENLARQQEIRVTYFQPDHRKSGGAYKTIYGSVKKIDSYHRQIHFTDGTVLPVEYLYSIEGELFEGTAGWEI